MQWYVTCHPARARECRLRIRKKANLCNGFDIEKSHVALVNIYNFTCANSKLEMPNILDIESVACGIKAHLFAKCLVLTRSPQLRGDGQGLVALDHWRSAWEPGSPESQLLDLNLNNYCHCRLPISDYQWNHLSIIKEQSWFQFSFSRAVVVSSLYNICC